MGVKFHCIAGFCLGDVAPGAFAGSMRNEEQQGPPMPEPPRRDFRFKPTEFEVTNNPDPDAPGNAPIDVRQLHRSAGAPTSHAPRNDQNQVHEMLRANLKRARGKGQFKVALGRNQPSRRKRDFWFLLIGGNLLVIAWVLFLGLNPVTLGYGVGSIALISVSLTWIMWLVMDDY